MQESIVNGEIVVRAGKYPLLEASLFACTVAIDDAGNCRVKKGSANTARDDVASALVLAAGEWARRRRPGELLPMFVVPGLGGAVRSVG